ncbi:MAG: PDZ domain-containing protein [Actinomycetota bacterium]
MDPTPEAPEPDATVGARTRPSRRRRVLVGLLVAGSIIGCAGFLVHVPYTTISPGSTVALTERVTVEGAKTYPDRRGDVRLLFVRERNNVNVWEYLRARLDGDTEIVADSVATGGQPSADLAAEAYADMEGAKLAAKKVALERAGYAIPPPRGVLVLAALPSRAGAAELEEGDVIIEVDGRPIVTGADLSRAVAAGEVGAVLPTVVRRDDRRETVEIRLSAGPRGAPVIGIRVFPAYAFPVEVSIDTEGIGGPSAGLAMTLAILDDLTPGNLTGGRRVAATGTIDTRGRVGPIGGIQQKGVSARAAGASIFLVPACPDAPNVEREACRRDLVELRRRAGSTVAVVPVADIGDALTALRERGGAPVVPVGAATARRSA